VGGPAIAIQEGRGEAQARQGAASNGEAQARQRAASNNAVYQIRLAGGPDANKKGIINT